MGVEGTVSPVTPGAASSGSVGHGDGPGDSVAFAGHEQAGPYQPGKVPLDLSLATVEVQPPRDPFELIRDVGRHYRAHIHLPHLTEAEIDAVWGTRGKSGCELWYSNLSWRCYAAIADNDAARRLVERCGKHGVMAASEGTNAGSSSGMNTNSSRSRGKNASYHEIARDLITVDEVQALRDDDLILLPRGYRPIRCRVPHFFRYPELRAIAGLPPLESVVSRLEGAASKLRPWLTALWQRAGSLINQARQA